MEIGCKCKTTKVVLKLCKIMDRHPNCESLCYDLLYQVGCYPGWIMISSSNEVTWQRVAESDMLSDIFAIDPDSRVRGSFVWLQRLAFGHFLKNFVGELRGLSSHNLIRGSQNWQRYGEVTSVLMSRVTYIILNGYMPNPFLKHQWWRLPILPGNLFQCFTCCYFIMAKSFLV